jgi:AcrR family transcriptional regulator
MAETMGTVARREREKQATRELILDAARDLFARDGYEAVTMRRIARQIEYSPTAIYLHFADKDALIRELCAVDFLALAQEFQPIALERDPVARVKRIGRAYIEFALAHPNHYRLMFMTPRLPGQEDMNDYGRKGDPAQDAYAFLRLAVVEALEQGRFRAGLTDPDLICQTLWAGVHGVAALHVGMSSDTWVEWRAPGQRIDAMLETLFSGLLRKD